MTYNRTPSPRWSKTFEFREGIPNLTGINGYNVMAQFRARVEFKDNLLKSLHVTAEKT